MRLRKAGLKQRVNASAALRFDATGLTSHAGMEFVRAYFSRLGLREKVTRLAGSVLPSSDYGRARMVILTLILIISGGRRLRHVDYLSHDPVIGRGCGMSRLPTSRTLGRWLSRFDEQSVAGLSRLNDELVGAAIDAAGLSRLTVDVDGSVVSTGLKVAGAKRGYNPHRRKVPSYYPITAYEAQSGQVLRVLNRPGNVHDGNASLTFLKGLVEQLKPGGRRLEFRMDGAFFRADVLDLLDDAGAEYAIKVPFFHWLGLKEAIRSRRRWRRIDETVECFELALKVRPWSRRERVLIYRKRVYHRTAKNFQLDLFDPDDGYFEYSAIATNKSLSGRYLWHFMCGRGTHEKVYGELKHGFAFSSVPTMDYHANSAWQVLSVMAFNLMRGFQVTAGIGRRRSNRKRRAIYRFETVQTLRFRYLQRAGLLLRPAGRTTLDVGCAPATRETFLQLERQLQKAA